MNSAPPVSGLVQTKDEATNIDGCLKSLAFLDEVVVFDSFSVDQTVELARRYPNVVVVQRSFDDSASHQNWALDNIRFANPWVLLVDADERVTPQLLDAIRRGVAADAPVSAYRVERRDYFRGRWIRHSQPTSRLIRLFRPENVRFERLINCVVNVRGIVSEIEGHLDHYPFSKGIDQWLERHNRYSRMEALELVGLRRSRPQPLRAFLTRDPLSRRATLKDWFYRLPARPQLKWMYYMLIRRCWLDGRPGLTYARLTCMYEHMISIKAEQLAAVDADERVTLQSRR